MLATTTLQGLEAASYIAQIFGTGSLIFLAFQLWLSMKELRVNSSREAGALALKEAEVFAEKIIPLHGSIRDKPLSRNFKLKKYPLERFSFEEYSANPKRIQYAQDAVKAISADDVLARDIMNFQNSMEALALSFTAKMADEKIAYSSISAVYLSMVEEFSFLFSVGRTEKKHNKSFNAVVELYLLWKDRETREDIGEEIKKLSAALKKPSPPELQPLGTD